MIVMDKTPLCMQISKTSINRKLSCQKLQQGSRKSCRRHMPLPAVMMWPSRCITAHLLQCQLHLSPTAATP